MGFDARVRGVSLGFGKGSRPEKRSRLRESPGTRDIKCLIGGFL